MATEIRMMMMMIIFHASVQTAKPYLLARAYPTRPVSLIPKQLPSAFPLYIAAMMGRGTSKEGGLECAQGIWATQGFP